MNKGSKITLYHLSIIQKLAICVEDFGILKFFVPIASEELTQKKELKFDKNQKRQVVQIFEAIYHKADSNTTTNVIVKQETLKSDNQNRICREILLL